MKAVFADSSFYVALLSPHDQNHSRAAALARELRVGVVLTEYVIAELGSAFSRRPDRRVFISLVRRLKGAPGTTVIPASNRLLERGFALFARRTDKEWSLIDCISFVVMRDMRLREALTADHHFVQAGFRALLR